MNGRTPLTRKIVAIRHSPTRGNAVADDEDRDRRVIDAVEGDAIVLGHLAMVRSRDTERQREEERPG